MTDQLGTPELRSILTSAKVGDLPLPAHPILDPTDTAAAAAQEMRNMGYGSAAVCQGGKLKGIVTERDVLRRINSGGDLELPLSDLMTEKPQTVTIEESLYEVIRLMDQGGYRRLPVVDGSGGPVGIVDVRSIVHFLVEHFPAAVYNQASHAQLIAKHREGA